MADDDLTVVPTAADKANEDFASFARLMKAQADYATDIAESRWKLYEAYKFVGFSKDESLILCAKLSL